MIEMMQDDSPRSAMTRSITASRGSLPIAAPICCEGHALVLAQRRVEDRAQHHAGGAARAVPLVLVRGGRIVHVALDALAGRRVLQPGQHLLGAALARPQRQARVEPVGGAAVGIDVGRDAQAAGAGGLDPAQHLAHLAPVGLVRGLEVPDLGRDARALGDGEHLVERGKHLVALRALVGDVDAAVARRHLGQRDQLVGRREPIGHVLQRRAQPERSLLHRLGHQLLHLRQLVRGGRRFALPITWSRTPPEPTKVPRLTAVFERSSRAKYSVSVRQSCSTP